MSEKLSDIYMVDPVLVDGQFDYTGELKDDSRQKIKYILEETLGQMGISTSDVLFCPREVGVVDNYVESMEAALQDLSEEIADKQAKGVYKKDPTEKDRDAEAVIQLKASVENPRPDWEFVGIDSLVKYAGIENPADEGVLSESFGVYDATKLRDRLDSVGSVSASAEEIEDTKLFDFYPRYMETEELAAWVFRNVLKESIKYRESVIEEPLPEDVSGQAIMDWVGRKAEAQGRVLSQKDLLEQLARYGINVPIN